MFTTLDTICMESGEQMVNVNIEKLLKKEKRSKYWLCQKINITSRNLNRIIMVKQVLFHLNILKNFVYI